MYVWTMYLEAYTSTPRRLPKFWPKNLPENLPDIVYVNWIDPLSLGCLYIIDVKNDVFDDCMKKLSVLQSIDIPSQWDGLLSWSLSQ